MIWKTTLCVSGTAVLCGVAVKKISEVVKHFGKKCEPTLNEVLFYGAESEAEMKEIGLNNLFCVYYVLTHAVQTIDVCMPHLTSETIIKCLVNVKKKSNIKIRVAIHNGSESDLTVLKAEGIEVLEVKCKERLQHEFIIVDAEETLDDVIAIIGSLDYETARVNCNRDSTIITSESVVINALKNEFNRIWSLNQSRQQTSQE